MSATSCLRQAEAKFQYILQLGLIHPFTNLWASSIHCRGREIEISVQSGIIIVWMPSLSPIVILYLICMAVIFFPSLIYSPSHTYLHTIYLQWISSPQHSLPLPVPSTCAHSFHLPLFFLNLVNSSTHHLLPSALTLLTLFRHLLLTWNSYVFPWMQDSLFLFPQYHTIPQLYGSCFTSYLVISLLQLVACKKHSYRGWIRKGI